MEAGRVTRSPEASTVARVLVVESYSDTLVICFVPSNYETLKTILTAITGREKNKGIRSLCSTKGIMLDQRYHVPTQITTCFERSNYEIDSTVGRARDNVAMRECLLASSLFGLNVTNDASNTVHVSVDCVEQKNVGECGSPWCAARSFLQLLRAALFQLS